MIVCDKTGANNQEMKIHRHTEIELLDNVLAANILKHFCETFTWTLFHVTWICMHSFLYPGDKEDTTEEIEQRAQ